MTTLIPPSRRACERCGREEVWDENEVTWTLDDEADVKGKPHCLHVWDINGSYNPFEGHS